MKCLVMRPIVTFFFVLIVKALTEQIDINDYLPLITDVYKYKHISSVIFIHHNYQDLNITTVMHTWTREFSRRGVMTVTITFPSLVTKYAQYKNIMRLLFVIILDSQESINEFVNITRRLKSIFSPIWLVLFLEFPGFSLETCKHPIDNIFHVNFHTRMLILCYNQPILTEWYIVDNNDIRTYEYATWSADKGLILQKERKSLYLERDNLFGKVVRVASVHDPPFIFLKNGTAAGFLGELMLELSKAINFKMQFLDQVNSYGSWDRQNKVWTGVISQLMTGQADIGVGGFSMTSQRLNVVDFTLPLIYTRNRLYIRQSDGSEVYWLGYLKTFHFGIWAMILIIIMCSPILLFLIKAKRCISMNSIMENYLHVWGIFCQQGLPKFPDETSMRLAFLSIFVTSLIIQATYSASFISFLTLPMANLPFSTMEGYVADGSYKLIVVKDSADYDMFYTSRNHILKKMNELMKKKELLPLKQLDGFAQICKEKKLAFYTTEVSKQAAEVKCKVVFIETGNADSIGLVLPKRSPYTEIINYNIQKFVDNGVLSRLKDHYLSVPDSEEDKRNEVGLKGVAPLLVMVASGMILGIFILILEKAHYVFKIRRKNGFIKKPSDKFDVKLRRRNNRKNVWLQRYYNKYYGRPIGYWS